jgi:integrase
MSFGKFKNQEEFINHARNNYPGNFRNMSDEDVYSEMQNILKEKGRILPDYTPPTFDIPNVPEKKSTYDEVDLTPDSWNDLYDLASKIGTSSAAELFIPESGISIADGLKVPGLGINISSDFFRSAYNNWNVGHLYQSIYGKKKYEYEASDYDKKNGGDILYEGGQALVGMLAPVEAGIILASGGFGSIGAKAAVGSANFFKGYGMKALTNNASKGLGVWGKNSIAGATSGGIGLGTFGFAHAALGSAANQKTTTGSIDTMKVMQDGSDGFLHSFLIGAPSGLLGKGLLGSYYAVNKLSEKPLMSLSRIAAGVPGQLTTEIASFTGIPNLYKELGFEDFKDYPAIWTPEWKAMAGVNAMIVTPMYGLHRGLSRLKRNKEVLDMADSHIENVREMRVKDAQAQDNLIANTRDFGLPKDILKTISDKKANVETDKVEISSYRKRKEELIEIFERTEGDISKATESDIALLKDVNSLKVFQDSQGVLLELKESRPALQAALDKKLGRTATEAEILAAETKIDSYLKDVEGMFKSIEKEATGLDRDVDPTEPVKDTEIAKEPRVEPEIPDTVEGLRDRLLIQTPKQHQDKSGRPTENWKELIESKIIEGDEAASISALKNLSREVGIAAAGPGDAPTTRHVYKPIEAEISNASSAKAKPYKDLVENYDALKLLDENNKVGLINAIETRVSAAKNPIADAKRALGELNKLMEYVGKTSLGDLNRFDTIKYFNSEVKRLKDAGLSDIISPNRTSDLNLLSKVLLEDGVIGKNFSSTLINKDFVKKQNIKSKTAGTAGGQAVTELNAAVNRLATGKGKTELDTSGKVTLKLMNELQARDGEINGLKWKHFDEKTGTLDLTEAGAGKGTGRSRFIYLDQPTINALKSLKGNKKPNQKIFGAKGAFRITKAFQLEANNSKATSKNLRKISQTKATNADLTEFEAAIWERLTGHNLKKGASDRTRVAEIYENLQFPEMARAFQKAVFNKVLGKGEGITPELQAKFKAQLPTQTVEFQRRATGTPRSREELKQFIREQALKNPEFEFKTLEDVDFAGRYYNGVIDVTMGKANFRTVWHELGHGLQDFAYKTNNKELIAIWKRGEKLFKKDAKDAGQPLKEFIPDELAAWARGQSRNKRVSGKMASWAKMMWTKIKKVLFGKSSLNKNDIRRLLGEKVYKGFATTKMPEGNSMAMYQYTSVKERADAVKQSFDTALQATGKKLSSADKKLLINYIANKAEIKDPSNFFLGDAKMKEADIIAFNDVINTTPFRELVKASDVGVKLKLLINVDNMQKGLQANDVKQMSSFFGIEGGNIYRASEKQLQRYQSYLLKVKHPGQKDNVAWIAEQASQARDMLPMDFKNVTGFKRIASLFGAPPHEITKMLGLKDLSKKLLQHNSIETDMIGDFTNKFENAAKKELGGKWEGRLGKGSQDDYIAVIDSERFFERLNNNDLTVGMKSLANKVFVKDYVIKENGVFVENPKYKNQLDAVNLSTPEGRVVKLWSDYTKLVKYHVTESTKNLFKTKEEHAEFLKRSPIRWVKDKIYAPRVPTKKAMSVLNPEGGMHYQKLLNEATLKIAKEMALEKHGANFTKEQMQKMADDAQMIAMSTIQDLFTFGKSKSKSRFIMSRSEKLPEFINVDGKRIKVYETSYENTFKSYGLGMSKFIANIEVFPDMVEYTHKNISGNFAKYNTAKTLSALSGQKEWGPWLKKLVDRQLGITETVDGLAGDVASGMETAATIYAKTILGFPTSGGKNFLYGQAMSMSTWKLRDYFRTWLDVWSSEFRNYVRNTGAPELGVRHITSLKTQKFWDGLFKFGLMRPSENINRYIDVAAGKYDQARLIKTIANPYQSAKKLKRAEHRLENFYHLNKRQVSLLKKYGQKGLSGHEFTNSFEKGKVKRELLGIEQQLNHYSHVNTQGAASHIFQPSWASGKMAKPLVLFKSMAYAAADNKVRNLKLAVHNRDMMKIAMMTLSPVASGYAISSVFNALLGTPMPKENSTWTEWIYDLNKRGEFMGVGTDFLRLLEGESAEFTIYPAIHNWAKASFDAIRAPILGKKTVTQSIDDWAKATSGGYRGLIKMIEKNGKNGWYNVGGRRVFNLWRDFHKEVLPEEGYETYEPKGLSDLTPRSPFYKDLRTVVRNGDREQIARQYVVTLYAVASSFYRAKIDFKGNPVISPDDALKKAVKSLTTTLTKLNPNPISFYDDLPKDKKAKLSRWNAWLKKDPNKYAEYLTLMKKLEDEYQRKTFGIEKYAKTLLASDPKLFKQVSKSMKELRLLK